VRRTRYGLSLTKPGTYDVAVYVGHLVLLYLAIKPDQIDLNIQLNDERVGRGGRRYWNIARGAMSGVARRGVGRLDQSSSAPPRPSLLLLQLLAILDATVFPPMPYIETVASFIPTRLRRRPFARIP
jgi:hypothetical protein